MKRIFLLVAVFALFFSCADMRRAELLYLQGKVDEASRELKELADRDFPKANYLLGKIALERGDTEEAIRYFKRAYQLGYVTAAKDIANIYLLQGDEEEALVWLEMAAEKGDISAEYLFYKYRLEIAEREKDVKEIRRVLKRLVYFGKEYPKAYVLLGDYYFRHGNLKEAVKYYKRAYLNGFVKAGIKIANIYLSLGDKKTAIAWYRELYSKGVRQAAYKIGKLYEAEAKTVGEGICPIAEAKSAEDYLKLRREIDGKKRSLLEEAVKWYRRAGDYLPARYRLLRLKWHAEGKVCGDYRLMVKFAQNGIREAYSDLLRLYASGRCSAPEDVKTVVKSLERLFTLGAPLKKERKASPGNYWLKLGKRLETSSPSKALFYLKKACKAGIDDAEIEIATLIKSKNPSLAEAVFLYHSKKGNPKATLLLAKMYMEKGLRDKAIPLLEKVASQGYRPAIDSLIDYGEVKLALKYLKPLKSSDPCFYHLVMSRLYGEGLGVPPDFSKSLEHLRIAEKKGCLEAKLRLAQVYYFSGKYKKALSYVNAYLKVKKSDANALALLAKIYMKLRDYDKATDYLVKAINNGYSPQLLELQFFFNKLKDRKLKKLKLSNALLVFLADKLSDTNFNASVCYAYRAALNKATGAAIFILRLGTKVNVQEQADFLKKVSKNPRVCRVYLRALENRLRKGNVTLSSLIDYLSSVGFSK